MQTAFMIDGSANETDEANFAERVYARQRLAHAMLRRLRLELQRQRERGTPFDEAWPMARRRAYEGVPGVPRQPWERAFSETRDAWHSAYECQPDEKVAKVAELEEVMA
jgi:hypothetical protein